MSDNKNPTGSNNYSMVDLLPNYYRTDANNKFIQATIDQLSQKGTAKKITGYIGRQNAKSANGSDVYIASPTKDRQSYQLEPSVVINDSAGNTTFFKDYQDYINQLKVFGSNVANHENINRQEFYSWDPHINWDKFSNFQDYYWLPYGPDLINITGQQLNVTSTYTVSISQSATLQKEYLFTPNGLDRNPTVTLYRGQTYYFEINSPGEPFSIKTARTLGSSDRYTDGKYVDNFAVESGKIKFVVPLDGPDTLYYLSERNADLGGLINFLDINENSYINVEKELLGKKTYTLSDGTSLSNGMKVAFRGNVTPAQYSKGEYYVEGVGTAIALIPTTVLEIISTYTQDKAVNFDSTSFDQYPFAAATSFAGIPDYITINRTSKDQNPWSRYNRWFHTDVITDSAKFNNKLADFDQASRAVRPIIEFEPNLKLFNFGKIAIADVDLVDDYTTDVFSVIEGSAGYSVDGVQLTQGMRVAFIADPDINVKNKIFKVSFINLENSGIGVPQIRLILDETPVVNSNMLVRQGVNYQGYNFWFDGSTWVYGQQKTIVNQAPLFDLFDETGLSFSEYSGSTFKGTKLFSYKIGTGTADTVLGFSLSYQNINNIGDILFSFNLLTDSFNYKDSDILITKIVNTGFLSRLTFTNTSEYVNGWQTSLVTRYQPAVRIYKNSGLTNNFALDIYDNKTDLLDLELRLYVNGRRLNPSAWQLIDAVNYKKIKLSKDIATTDVLTIKAFAKQPINSNGYYEVPINLQNNPLNKDIGNFTLGEVTDHLNSIIDNIQGIYVETDSGVNNLSDLGNITPYGTKFVQHSGPASLALYHITSEQNNIVRALEKSRDDYGKFKRSFLLAAKTLGVDTDVVTQVNTILKTLSANKTQKSSYYFSDMAPFTGKKVTEYSVVDTENKLYPLSTTFDNTVISNKAVSVYIDGVQLLYGINYSFTADGYVLLNNNVLLVEGDTIVIYEYDSTDGCFIPPTPTKLGLWPKFTPKIYVDNSYATPQTLIQGHDGSQILAYGDYRDAIILELEKRIYNNIQVEYDPTIFDIYNIIPGYHRKSNFTLDEFNKSLAPGFYKWAAITGRDFSKQYGFNKSNTFTYNYKGHSAPDGRELPGYWRGIYRWMYDTDKPHLFPWEMLGFSEEPTWWQEKYGPAPYTSNNIIMWEDLAKGAVSEPGMPVEYRSQFVRPTLLNHLPVDENGNLISPASARLSNGVFNADIQSHHVFGDVAPVESAWRRSSYFPFSTIIASMILQPGQTFATGLDISRTVRNLCGQLVYKDTNLRIRPQDVVLPSIYSSTSRVYTSGIVNYLVESLISSNFNYYNDYQYNLSNLNINLSYRISGFSSKENFNLILDSKNPAASGNVFVPPENYKLVYNSSSPINKISYSGVIVSKVDTGYEIKGYSSSESFFNYYSYRQELGPQINVGGISASFVNWTAGKTYALGQIVLYSGKYYRTLYAVTQDTFNVNAFALLPSLPISGGVTATFRQSWDTTTVNVLPYGSTLGSIQEVVDFLLGYGAYLKNQGFVFDDFNNALSQVSNWETTSKEFMFWTTQKWSAGQSQWEQWIPNIAVAYGQVVKYQDEYYKAIQNVPAQPTFDEDFYFKLDGLSTVGSAVISLSPAANKLTFVSPLSVAEDINNPFNDYEIFQVDGTSLLPMDINSSRQGNLVTFSPANNGTIYNASFYLVQKEQVLILDNATVFNDIIYNPESGYRQERIKVSGFVSSQWFGGFEVPGFIFDRADIAPWKTWTDYASGDIVYYQGYYYSANDFLPGAFEFDFTNWSQIKKPTPTLLPNWSYKAGQFEDFYNLTEDNFDSGQQRIAQHLVGYQKRQYLNNIIQDDISEFQFYQGMICEKGTQNSLNKLFDVLSADNKESITFFEEWAVRVGQYGASQAYEAIEFLVTQPDVTKNSQGFYLTLSPERSTNFNLNIPANKVYLKPQGYNAEPFPVNNNQKFFLRSGGYVQASTDTVQVKSIADLSTQDITKFKDGTYIWVAFEKTNWNIYRFTSVKLMPVDAVYNNDKTITITTSNFVDPSIVGYYIGLQQVSFAGFYKVVSAELTTLTVEASNFSPAGNWPSADTIKSNLQIFNLYPVRASSINDANTIIKAYTELGDKIWVDDDGTGKWASLELTSVFDQSAIRKPYTAQDTAHGRVVTLSADGLIAAVATQVGEVIIYEKQGKQWIFRQIIKRPFMAQYEFGVDPNPASTFAETMAMSADGQFLAVGSPQVGTLATKVLPNGNVICDKSSANASTTLTGAVSLYQKDAYNEFILLFTIVSGDNISGQQFGASLVFGTDKLFVGSRGNTNYGTQATVFELRFLAGINNSENVTNTNADGDTASAVATVTYDAGNAFSTSNSSSDISFDGGSALTINSTADRWVINRPGISVANGTTIGFGLSLSVSKDNSILAIGAPLGGSVYLYRLNTNGDYTLSQTINGPTQIVTEATTVDGVSSFNTLTLDGGYGFKTAANNFTNTLLTNLSTTGGKGTGLVVDGSVDTNGIIQKVNIREPGRNYQVGNTITVMNPLGSGSVLSLDWASAKSTTYTNIASSGYNTSSGTISSTVATGTIVLSASDSSLVNGTRIIITGGGNGLVAGTYYVVSKVGTSVRLASTYQNAIDLIAITGVTTNTVTNTSYIVGGTTGSSATFNVTNISNTYSVTLNTAGTNYAVGDTLRIAGNLLGGISPSNDLIVQVTSIGVAFPLLAGPIGSITIISGYAGKWYTGVRYVTGDTVYYNNTKYVAIANTIGDIPSSSPSYWSQISFANALVGTDINTTTATGSGSGLKIKIATAISSGNLSAGSTVIPVTTINNFKTGQPVFSSTSPKAFASGTYITQVNNASFVSTLSDNVLTVSSITAGDNNVIAKIVGSIEGIILTAEEISGGQILPGMILTGTGVPENIFIVSGSGNSWIINNPISVSNIQITATLYETIKPGMQLTNPALDNPATFTGSISAKGTATLTGATTTLIGGISSLYNATISGTSLTFDAVTGGDPVVPGMTLTGAGVTAGTKLLYGSGGNWVVSTSQTIASPVTITATLTTASINGYNLTFSTFTGVSLQPGAVVTGGTVAPGTKIVGGSGTSWNVDINQTATCTGAYQPFGTISGNTLTFTAKTGADIEIGMAVTGSTTVPGTFITGGSGTTWTVNINQTTTCTQVTLQSFLIDAQIIDTTLTFTSSTGADLIPGMVLTGSGVISGTYVVSGSEFEWVVSTLHGVAVVPTTITATPVYLTVSGTVTGAVLLGQQISGSGVNASTKVVAAGTGEGGAGTYLVTPIQTIGANPFTSRYIYTRPTIISGITLTGAIISGTTLTFSGNTGGGLQAGMLVTGSNVLPGTKIVSGSSTSWVVDKTQNVSVTTLLATGTGTGGTGTYIIDQILPVGINVTRGISLVINTGLADALAGQAEVTSLTISDYGTGYNVNDIVQFNITGSANLIRAQVSEVTRHATITVASISDGSITKDASQFASSVKLSTSGEYLAIGSPLYSGVAGYEGQVLVYSNNTSTQNTYSLFQQIENPHSVSGDLFGKTVEFSTDNKTLLVYSPGADSFILTTFDADNLITTFDANSLEFKELTLNSGKIDVYTRYVTNWILGESLYNANATTDGFGQSFAIADDLILVGAPHETDIVSDKQNSVAIEQLNSGKVYSYERQANSVNWNPIHKQTDLVDLTKIKQVFLYNKSTNKLIKYLDVIDPNFGKIAGSAEQEISYKTFYDPAVYSVGNSSVNMDTGSAWTTAHVSKLWWDLRTAKFVDSHAEDIVYRNSTLNMLATGASVDIYEWVETKLTPTEWKAQADTSTGLTKGISGQPLYTDAYSIKQHYNTFTKVYENTYYFWVKNKVLVPEVESRSTSAYSVSRLIGNPRGENYAYASITGKNSFNLVNCQQLLSGDDVVLGIEYWVIGNTTQNTHAQWKLIDNNPNTNLPSAVENKWFDSLCGKDQADRPVPDLGLPAKLRFGIESRPRQSMFVNNFEALKQFVERANRILIKEQIVEQKNISLLDSYDVAPYTFTGEYDTTVDTDAELRVIAVTTAKPAYVSPIIVNGSITGITIISAGSGYINTPPITVFGKGSGAKLKAIIDIAGSIIGVTVLNGGKGYTSSTTLEVRPFSALVKSDSAASGNWSIYAYTLNTITSTKSWVRVRTQSYDVRSYWSYADWYATGFNQFTVVDHAIDTFAEIGTITPVVGQTLKIRVAGSKGWQLLSCYSSALSLDWTQQYNVVGIENGTIQLSQKLYDFKDNNIGFDGSTFDGIGYDTTASKELRIILNCLKSEILTDTLKQNYLDLFFASIRYAHAEQTYIDWAFKTSFVKAQHNVGDLKQTVTYTNDNLSNFEDYIKEVVPYRTTVREYVSNYTSTDNSSSVITDFDLPAIFNNTSNSVVKTEVQQGKVVASNNLIQAYPWKHWLENLGFQLTSIVITTAGTGYVSEPKVRIISDSGSGAVARAYVANGKVTRVDLLNPGSGYLTAPTIIIDGGSSSTSKTAKAVAIIGKSLVRSSLIKMKFDRINSKYYIIQLNETQTFAGGPNNYKLTWAPDIKINASTVKVNGITVLRDTYTLSVVKSTSKGYTTYSGLLKFDSGQEPTVGTTVTIDYLKDIDLLNATDRIQYFYDPASGQLGKDLNQLMTGVDYGGVIVTGTDYNTASGWESVGYMQDLWDSYENTYNDYIVSIDSTSAVSRTFELPYTPEVFTNINIYYQPTVNNVYTSDGAKLIYTFDLNYNYVNSIKVTIDKTVSGLAKTVTSTSTETTTVIQTVNGFNTLRIASVANLSVGKAIKFLSGTANTGLIVNQTYYVKTINLSSNTFTISITNGGPVVTVNDMPTGVNPTLNLVMQYGTSTNYLTANTSSMYVGMPFQFSGNTLLGGVVANKTYYVSQIVDSTNFTISLTSGGPVLALTSAVGTMSLRQVAASPESTLFLTNVSGLKVGDVATTTIDGAIADGTRIVKVNANSVELSNILYGDILATTPITFVRTLTAPVNFRYITNNSLQLSEAPITGSIITISAAKDPIRIDDPNYDKQWIITATEATTNIITTVTPITFEVGDLITFTGTTIGNINANTPYYVQAVIDNRHFKISATVGLPGPNPTGVEFKLKSATGSFVARSTGNATAVMATYVADGLQPIIKIPNTYTLVAGDLIIFRKSTSDGSVSVNSNDLDTVLDGGTLVYNTATGLAPDDIIIDGDGFVTTTTGSGPEELVQGQVVDSVAIKVFDRPSDGSATLKVLNYIADGTNKKFNLEQFPNSSNAVYVKVNSNILTTGTDYTLDYPTKNVVLRTAPAAGSIVTLHSFGFNGTNILDVDYFISDGKTKEFITKAPYLDTPFTYIVYLDGVAIQPTLFKTDLSYDSPNRIGFRFSIAPNKFQVLNYLIISGTQQTFSIFKTEKLATDGSTTYTLANTIGSSLPLESSIIVRANQNLLNGPNNNYFTISSNRYDYSLDILSTQPYSINTDDLTVYADGNLLKLSTDYTVDTSGVTVSINKKVYSTYKGKKLIINVKSAQDYYIVGSTISFNQAYTSNDYVEVVSAYKHDILQIQRSRVKATNNLQFTSASANYYRYTAVLGGKIELPSTITTEAQLWVTKNRTLLINGIDYRINPDLASINLDAPVTVNDEFECIIFAGSPVKQGLSYMQFKDILNRTVYKRLSLYKQNTLAQDLYYSDSVIYVKDAGNFDKPNPALNKPGIIEINGERIEYFTIKNNTTLGQLRRGTLGTGIPLVHGAGSRVQDIGPGETIPYTDTFKTENNIVDEVNINKIIPLSFTPAKDSSWTVSPSEFGLFDNAVVQRFISKTGTGPYLVKFAVPQQQYAPAVGKTLLITNNSNVKYNGYYKVSSADISNTVEFIPTLIEATSTVGTSISVTFTIPTQTVAPLTQNYYIIKGAMPEEYNSTWLCTGSTTTSITLTITNNYGTFKSLPTSIVSAHSITIAYPTDPGTYGTKQITTISAPKYGQANEIEVFVGGYDDLTTWSANTIFVAEQIITVNSYAYKITTTHRSGATFNSPVTTLDETNSIIATNVLATSVRTLFVGNIRLKKKPYSVHTIENAPNSPEGDITFGADFAVDGINPEVILRNKLSPGTVVTVTRKLGQSWTETGVSLQDSQTKIAKFITAVPGVWLATNKTTSTQTAATATTTFDNVTKSFDNDDTTFDQGN